MKNNKIILPDIVTIFSIAPNTKYSDFDFVIEEKKQFQMYDNFNNKLNKLPSTIEELKSVQHRLSVTKRGGIIPFNLRELKTICKNFNLVCVNKKIGVDRLLKLLK